MTCSRSLVARIRHVVARRQREPRMSQSEYQIIKGEAEITVGKESVAGKPGTWIQMAARTPHSIKAESPVVMVLTM